MRSMASAGKHQSVEPRAGVVALRPLRHSDRHAVRRWMRDPSLIRFTVLVPGPEYAPVEPYSTVDADRYLSILVDDPLRRTFAICLDGRHIGNVGLREIDLEAGYAECFVELGAQEARGRGYAKNAMAKLLAYAFEHLKLERVRLGVFEFNRRAIRLYEQLGFEKTGQYGRHWADGRYWEVHAMELCRAGWTRSANPVRSTPFSSSH